MIIYFIYWCFYPRGIENFQKTPLKCNFLSISDQNHFLYFRRHLVNERNREELDEVSNRRLTNMAIDISRGLSYLAELKYVHRDIACRNCLVNSTRVVKLADFGMTRPMYENDYYRFSRKGKFGVNYRFLIILDY